MNYIVIYFHEDGENIYNFSKEELLNRLSDNHWGENVHILDKFPDDFRRLDSNCLLIIQGDIVVPKPIQVVKQYSL